MRTSFVIFLFFESTLQINSNISVDDLYFLVVAAFPETLPECIDPLFRNSKSVPDTNQIIFQRMKFLKIWRFHLYYLKSIGATDGISCNRKAQIGHAMQVPQFPDH